MPREARRATIPYKVWRKARIKQTNVKALHKKHKLAGRGAPDVIGLKVGERGRGPEAAQEAIGFKVGERRPGLCRGVRQRRSRGGGGEGRGGRAHACAPTLARECLSKKHLAWG